MNEEKLNKRRFKVKEARILFSLNYGKNARELSSHVIFYFVTTSVAL